MVLSIHSSGVFQGDNNWPSFWPPVKLPPPSPLSEAASTLWSPTVSTANAAKAGETTGPLYSTQLTTNGSGTTDEAQGRFQMAFIDKRIALMRYDASHTDNVAA